MTQQQTKFHYHSQQVLLPAVSKLYLYTHLDLSQVNFIVSKLLLQIGQVLYITNEWLRFCNLFNEHAHI